MYPSKYTWNLLQVHFASGIVRCRDGSASPHILRPTLDGSGVQIPRDQFGLIWSKLNPLSWTLVWILALHLDSSYHELSFLSSFFWFWTNWFSLQNGAHVSFSLHSSLFGLGPSSKGSGSNLYGSHPIGLLYFIWTLDHHLKWPKPFLIVRLSKLPSWLCLFLRVNLAIYKGCEIVNATTPNLATLGHPQLKFSRLPILDMYSISAQFLQAAKVWKGLKTSLSLSLSSSSSRVNFMTLWSLRWGKILFFLKERKTQQ